MKPLHAMVRRFDDAVDTQFDRVRGHPVLNRVFYGASAVGDHGLVWLFLGALRGLRTEKHHRHAAIRLGIGVGVESLLVNVGIKSLFRRKRPTWELPMARPLHLRQPRTSSFPSGHATSAFTAAALLGEGDPLKPLYYVIALVVAWSRVYVKIHHASDVVAGIGIGIVLGRIGKRISPLPPPLTGIPVANARLEDV